MDPLLANKLFRDVDEMMRQRDEASNGQLLYGAKTSEQRDHYIKVLKKNKVNVKNIYSQLNIPSVKTFERNNFRGKKNSQIFHNNRSGPSIESKA